MPSAFRTDIQALRAIAVLLVVAFHVWPAKVRGGYVGVDVFFVISGYLITGHLVREVASTGRVDLPTFYARRARRLLPAASLTLVAVGLASFLWVPAFIWPTVATDMAASTLYAENWALIRRAVDYNTQGQAPSPLQHFWSLAVEEQFYLGWPLLVAGVAATWARKAGSKVAALPGIASPPPPRRAYAAPMGVLCGLSFLASLHYARANPAAGYFMTHTRLHELGLGGLLAVWAAGAQAGPHAGVKPGIPASHPTSHWPRTLCAAAGLVAIGASGCLFTARLPFPGSAALVPVVGVAAVIAAGERLGGDGVSHAHALAPALAHPWLQYVGDISYSLYLAHWPVIVVYPFVTGRAVDGMLADGVTVIVLSWALAHACKRGWEDRFQWATSQAVVSKDVGLASSLATLPSNGPGFATRRAVGCPSDPLVRTLVSTLLNMTAVSGIAFWLHLQMPLSPALVHDPATHPIQTRAPVVDNHTANAGRRCPFFSGTNITNLYPGADAVLHGCPVLNSLPLSSVRPAISIVKQDYIPKVHPCFEGRHGNSKFDAGRPHCASLQRRNMTQCKHVVLIGDSHAEHFWPAFDVLSKRMGLFFTLLNKGGCPPTATLIRREDSHKGLPDTGCQQFVSSAIDWVLHEKPSLVILSSHNIYGAVKNDSNGTTVEAGVVVIAKRLIDAGIPVLGMKGTPTLQNDAAMCLSKELARMGNSTNITACEVSRSMGLSKSLLPEYHKYPVDEAARMYPILRMLSLDETLCPGGICSPIIGNVPVYRDRHHMTVAFARTLANVLELKLRDAAPHLGIPCNGTGQ